MLFLGGIALVLLSVLSSGLSSPPFLGEDIIEISQIATSTKNSTLNYRLPNDTLPEAYTVEVTTNVHTGDKDFTGTVQIDLKVVETTSTITIHALQLTGFEANIIRTDQTSATSNVLTTNYINETEFLQFSASGLEFPKGSKWRLTINYKGTLRTDNKGFYLSSYEDKQKQRRYLATTQFESTDARHGFPCYDEPAKRANFTIKINHDPSYTAISNMPVDTEKSKPGHTVFQTLISSPSYLVAFIVSDFTQSKGELDMLPQRMFSKPGSEDSREFALISGMLTMNRLNTYYGIHYPLPKLDIVAIPDFAAGAMENWGLTTYREDSSLYNSKNSSVSTQSRVASIIAHENTHQWFGNLVAIKWWTYLWLKEGFATLFENQMTIESFPEWDYKQEAFVKHFVRTLRSDAYSSARPMTFYIEDPKRIRSLYDYVSYSKAGCVLHMWQHALTDAVFQKGLQNYLNTNKYSAADEDDLFEAIQIAAGEENFPVVARVKDMMSSWSRQSNYPVLTVLRDYKKGTFNVTQEAYFEDAFIKRLNTWYIPFNFVTGSDPDFSGTIATHYLKKTKTLNVDNLNISKDHWLLLNKQVTGLYRINYDQQNWNLITKQLLEKHYKIHTLNRAQLLYDAYEFGISKRLPHSTFLEMLSYLPEEDQYAPWYVVNLAITLINRYLKADSKYNNFQKFVAQLVEKPYDKLGANDVPGESHLQPFIRSIIVNLASIGGIESCSSDIKEKISNSIDKNIPIEPNMIEVTYCNGLKQADDRTFNSVYNLLMETSDQAIRNTLIRALACSESPTQIRKFLESSLDTSNKLRTQERTTLLSPTISSSPVGIDQSILFLKRHWDEYAALTPGFTGRSPPENDLLIISVYVVNLTQYAKVQDLLDSVRRKLSRNVQQTALKNIALNLLWTIEHGKPIMDWINKEVKDKKPKPSSATMTSLTFGSLIVCFLAYLV